MVAMKTLREYRKKGGSTGKRAGVPEKGAAPYRLRSPLARMGRIPETPDNESLILNESKLARFSPISIKDYRFWQRGSQAQRAMEPQSSPGESAEPAPRPVQRSIGSRRVSVGAAWNWPLCDLWTEGKAAQRPERKAAGTIARSGRLATVNPNG
jgi:hypothetical protein